MMKSNFRIPKITPDVVELIDLGPWNRYQTVTNDAEAVVEYLHSKQMIQPQTQIIYQDSDGEWGELFHDGVGNFTGFGFAQRD